MRDVAARGPRWVAGRAALCLAAVTAVVVAAAAPALAVEAQGLRLDPVEVGVLGEGSTLRPALPPGTSVTYPLRLRNTREVPVEALVYGADVEGGEVASGADNTGVGAWLTTPDPVVSLEPASDVVVEVTITRPDDDTAGGPGAIVVQLSDASRQELGLESVQRAALPVEVAADGGGDGTPVSITSTGAVPGLLPGDVTVEVVVTNPGGEPAAPDAVVRVARLIGEDARIPIEVGTIAPGASVTTTMVVDVPWWGLVGSMRAETAVVGLTSRSAPARVAIVPPWAVLLLVAAALVATLRARRGHDREFDLGTVPGHATAHDARAPDDEVTEGDATPVDRTGSE